MPAVSGRLVSPPAPDDPDRNVRATVWIPGFDQPLDGVAPGILSHGLVLDARVPFFSVDFPCRGGTCDTTAVGNPSIGASLRRRVGVWRTQVGLRLYAPLADGDLDDGRPHRDAAALAPELLPDLTPDAVPLAGTALAHARLYPWLALEGEALAAGLIPTADDGGGALLSARLDAHLIAAGDDPAALGIFVRSRMTGRFVEPNAGSVHGIGGARFTLGGEPTLPRLRLEVAARMALWNNDPRLEDLSMLAGYQATLAVGLPPL